MHQHLLAHAAIVRLMQFQTDLSNPLPCAAAGPGSAPSSAARRARRSDYYRVDERASGARGAATSACWRFPSLVALSSRSLAFSEERISRTTNQTTAPWPGPSSGEACAVRGGAERAYCRYGHEPMQGRQLRVPVRQRGTLHLDAPSSSGRQLRQLPSAHGVEVASSETTKDAAGVRSRTTGGFSPPLKHLP